MMRRRETIPELVFALVAVATILFGETQVAVAQTSPSDDHHPDAASTTSQPDGSRQNATSGNATPAGAGMMMGPEMMEMMQGGGTGTGMMGPPMMGMMQGGGMGPSMMGPKMMGMMPSRGMSPGMMAPMAPCGGMGPGMMGPHGMAMMPYAGMGVGMMGSPMMGMMGGGGPGGQKPYMAGYGFGAGQMMWNRAGGALGVVLPSRRVSVEDVRGYFQDRLEMWDNPRLKVGEVKASDDGQILAEIITVDGALVDRLSVDERTGVIRRPR